MNILRLLLIVLLTGTALADSFEIKVQRKTLDREDRIKRPKLQAEELTVLLNIAITNKSGKPTGETELEWSVIVAHAGPNAAALHTGTQKLAVMANSQTLTAETDAFPVLKTRVGRQDLEYKIILKQDGKEIARTTSTPTFDQLASAAKPDKKDRKKNKE